MKTKSVLLNVLKYIILVLILIFTVFPLIYAFACAFKTNMELMSRPDRIFPIDPTFENFSIAWSSEKFNVPRMFFNSVWYTSVSVVITIIVASVSGYVFARSEFPGKKLIFAMFSSLMFISLGSITIYPLFDILSGIGLNKSLWGLVVVQCFGIPVVNMYLVKGFVQALPIDLDEAATIDGCTFTGIFFRIILPLLKPIIATIAILAFNHTWNSYLMPSLFTMTSPKQQTLIVGVIALKNSGEGATSWNLMFAGTAIALVPVIFLFIFGNKYITKGIVTGAVKG